MISRCNRRHFISTVGSAAAGAWLSGSNLSFASTAPTAPVSVARCPEYGSNVLPTLETMFDQLGGLQRIVNGKTVAVKLNLTGSPTDRMQGVPVDQTQWVHQDVVGATVQLLGKAGARRVRLLESAMASTMSLEEYMIRAGWSPRDFMSAAPDVEFENTNYLGYGKKYTRFWVPGGGQIFKAYDLNHSYEDCDVFVSIAKLKEHGTAGVTLSMKNCFGTAPCTIYGDDAGLDEPSLAPRANRDATFHFGKRQPSKSALAEKDPSSPRDPGYRVPRIVTDLVASRPIHLAVIDGIQTMGGGEGPWIPHTRRIVPPGLLIAGTNCVTTDAVATAIMGFDPMADRGTAPFEKCDSTLKLAEKLGIGTRDLRRIEVRGLPLSKAAFNIRGA